MSDKKGVHPDEERSAVVAAALKQLQVEERELVVQIYFLGRTYEEISRRSGRRSHRLQSLHQRALRKLRRALRDYVKRRYGIQIRKPACPICESPHCSEINALIKNRDRTDTWRPVVDKIREVYGLDVRSPQRLIGHERYHLIKSKFRSEEGGLQ